MILILVFISIFFIFFSKNKSIAFPLICLQLISAIGALFLGRNIKIENITDILWVILTVFLIFIIILPWKSYFNITGIIGINENKLRKVTWFLIIVNSFVFIVFAITSYTVFTLVSDINNFKYSEGESMKFYYTMLPFPTVFFNLSLLLYFFSYFILPLHFYYLYKKKYKLSFICFVLSLNIVLYGLTFFSRAVVVQFLFLYIAMLYILFNTLSDKVKQNVRKVSLIIGSISVIYLINITQKRFVEDERTSSYYESFIPKDAIIQDVMTYSFVDYMSQSFFNGNDVLKMYNGEGFNGNLTLESFLNIVSPGSIEERVQQKQKLWTNKYWFTFNGFSAYAIYDFGVIGSILFGLSYYFLVKRLRPQKNRLKLTDLLFIVLLVQIPLMAIFYNQLGGIIIPLFFSVFLRFYMKKNIEFTIKNINERKLL